MGTKHPPEQWEDLLSRELKGLPDRPAPDTLIPRVLAALEERACLPWYQQTWWTWPPAVRLVSLLLFSALLGGLTWVALHAGESVVMAEAGGRFTGWWASLQPAWTVVNSVINALALAIRQTGGWLLVGGVTFCAAMYLSCVGLGTMFYRVAIKNR